MEIKIPKTKREAYDQLDEMLYLQEEPDNWNEGLDRELTKDMHLIHAFHNLFQHMLFAITDFIYVRNFRTEINIEIVK